MKNFRYLSVFLLIPFSLFAMTDNVVVVKKPVREIYEDTSEANRLNKQYGVFANLLGIGPTHVPNTGLGVSFHLSSNQLMLVEYRGGRGMPIRSYVSSSSYGVSKGETKIDFISLGLHYKQFVSNSFYFRTGADLTQVSYSYNYIAPGIIEANYKSEYQGKNISVNFTIGNQWQWENFTLGCDWLGYSLPIASKLDKSRISGNPDELHVADFNEDKKYFMNNNSFVLLRFYLGATF